MVFVAGGGEEPATSDEYLLMNARTRSALAERLTVARTPWRRLLGLLGRRWLYRGEGTRFLPETTAPPSHREAARLSVDLLFLDREGRVLHTFASLSPFDANERTVHSVVELPAGTFARLETRPGDVIEMYRRPADPVEDDVEPQSA